MQISLGIEEKIEEYSYDYKRWLELPEEEKAKILAPTMYTIPITREDVLDRNMQDMVLRGNIPSSYMINTIPISNQGELNICWTYCSNLVLQTTVKKTLRQQEAIRNYSEKHMDYSLSAVLSPTGIEDGRGTLNESGYWRNTNTGGNINKALAYWISGRGPVLESYMPYSNTNAMDSANELKNAPVDVQVDGSIEFANVYKRHNSNNTITYGSGSDFTTTYTEEQVVTNRNNIKLHIMNNGGIYAAIHMEDTYTEDLSSVNAYLSKNKYDSTHAVAIVGWDDDYAVTNFKEGKRPTKPGAWLCANSWGTDWGNNGLFYVSYEDSLIESDVTGITNVSEINYDKIYQYDILYNYTTGYSSNVAYAANVFGKTSNTIEKLNAVTVYINNKNATYEIYVNPYNDNKDINSSDVIKVGTITSNKVGYNTLKLDNPVKIYGDKWTVIEKITAGNGEKARIALESNTGGEYSTVKSNAGESFIGYVSGSRMEDVSADEGNNVIIKARTVEMVSNSYINQSAESRILKEGQVLTIKIGMTEEVSGTAPTLKLRWGNGSIKNATFVSLNNGTELVYKYTVQKEDNGLLTYEELTGGNLVATSGKEIAYDLVELKEDKIMADNIPPEAIVTYNVSDINKKTNQTIIATVTFNEENVSILNNEGRNTYTFERNGSFTFEFQDQVGNMGTKTITINSIDKDMPEIEIKNNGSTTVSKEHSTVVRARDQSSRIVKLGYIWLPETQTPVNPTWTTFTNGGIITKDTGDGNWKLYIMAEDEAGNQIIKVSEIFTFDNTAPTATIEYTEQETTITATVKFTEPNVIITNNEGKPSYVFERNGSFTFKFKDTAGNTGEKTATIDKLTAFTEEDIKHSYDVITGTDRKYMRINHFREMQYDNKYTLSMQEMVKEIITQSRHEVSDDGNGNVDVDINNNITINSSTSKVYAYTSTNQIASPQDTVKTGMKLRVGDNEYTMVCTGDINGDGQISLTDVSKIKLDIVELENLNEASSYAADINGDSKIGLTDLSNVKLKIVGM